MRIAAKQLGIELDEVSPRTRLQELPLQVPVVLVHAGDDDLIPVSQGEQLAAVRPGQELHLVPGAGHGGCLHAGWPQLEGLLRDLLVRVRKR